MVIIKLSSRTNFLVLFIQINFEVIETSARKWSIKPKGLKVPNFFVTSHEKQKFAKYFDIIPF